MNKKNTQVKQEKLGFWRWVHKYRLKIVALSFIVLVPLALLISVYVGSYTNNRKIYFDPEMTSETAVISSYRKVNPEKLEVTDTYYYEIDDVDNHFDLYILWEQLNKPYVNSETGDLDFGSYRFKMYYQANENITLNFVNITPLLQTDWTTIRSLGTATAVTSSTQSPSTLVVNFNYRMPRNPLPLIKVESPHLYLKVTYQINEDSTTVDKVTYIQFDLSKANPREVTPLD